MHKGITLSERLLTFHADQIHFTCNSCSRNPNFYHWLLMYSWLSIGSLDSAAPPESSGPRMTQTSPPDMAFQQSLLCQVDYSWNYIK